MKLVTGGTGLLGSHLLHSLVSGGSAIRATYRRKSSIEKTRQIFSYYGSDSLKRFHSIEWVKADLLDVCQLEKVCNGIQEVYHCAGMVSFNQKHHHLMMKTNVEGTANLLNASLNAGVTKFCHVSSIATFGRPEKNADFVHENSRHDENDRFSMYAKSKYLAELEVWRAAEEGLNAMIINPSTIIGSGNWEYGSSAIFSRVKKGLLFYTEGINGFIDVRDVVNAMKALMERNAFREQFILVGENLSFKVLLSYISEGLGLKAPAYRATKIMSEILWRFEQIRCLVQGSEPVITKESAKIALDKQFYSNAKVKERLNMEFIPIQQAVNEASRNFKS
ncbi:MAG: NAD-dependent epimerase/dehydratase family protein [Vicingaceae bacterium]